MSRHNFLFTSGWSPWAGTAYALFAFTVAFTNTAIAQEDQAPVVFWGETRRTSGAPTRFFYKNLPISGEGIGFIVYADTSWSGNNIGGIEFEVEYPENNVNLVNEGAINPNDGYIWGGYDVASEQDFFKGAQMSSTNKSGLITRRFLSSTAQAEDLVNQSSPGRYPLAILNFRASPENSAGQCKFKIKSPRAYDLSGREVPSTSVETAVFVVSNDDHISLFKTNAYLIQDRVDLNGENISSLRAEAYKLGENDFIRLQVSEDLINWRTITTSEYSPKYKCQVLWDFMDLSAIGKDMSFYRIVR